ncbi:hypothetical protein [Vibrio sp. HN007]|uniref:hypothetical protein n=1 Tax=Vibrio iocasae TaxID=3098914 RepID=UPI0035D46EC0
MAGKSIVEKMEWFNPEDPEMARWLRSYAKKQDWIIQLVEDRPIYSDTDFCNAFLSVWLSNNIFDHAEKHRATLVRSAWNSYSKKSKNVTLSLSTNAQKALKFISERQKISKTKVVNDLLINYVNLIKKNRRMESSLLIPEMDEKTQQNNEIFESLLSIEELKKENEELKIKIEKYEVISSNQSTQ